MTTLAEALAPKSDQLNAADLISGPRVLKITKARISKEDRATKIVLNFEGDNGKPWKPCKTMGRGMVMAWAITDEEQFVGKSVRVYRDPTVTFGAEGEIGGIRISHLSHIDKPATAKLMVSKGKYALFTFNPLVTEAPRQTAEEWAETHIAAVERVDSLERLAEMQTNSARALEKLAATKAETHKRVIDAYAQRLDELSANNEPATGRADTDHGDQFPGDEPQEQEA